MVNVILCSLKGTMFVSGSNHILAVVVSGLHME